MIQPKISPTNIKSVFRYGRKEHIDDFFKTGKLKLSTYFSNREAENKARKDEMEGKQFNRIHNKSGDYFVDLVNEPYKGWFTFCTSAEYNPEKFFTLFDSNSCFEITDLKGFANEVAKVLEKYSNGFMGPVIYSDDRYFNYYLHDFPHAPDISKDTHMQDLVILLSNLTMGDKKIFFRKRKYFLPQFEFRFVWRVINFNHSEFIICPEARKYCRVVN
ncbi:MAG: hypothetical protein AB8B80_02100 [Marinicellaceae bacterium]